MLTCTGLFIHYFIGIRKYGCINGCSVWFAKKKKSAGISFRDSLRGHLFFGQQERMDEHVASASLQRRKEPKVCNYSDNKYYMYVLRNTAAADM